MKSRADRLAEFFDVTYIVDRLEALQARGEAHGRAGWYPDHDYSSDADWVYGPGAEIARLDDLLGVDDDSVFRVYSQCR